MVFSEILTNLNGHSLKHQYFVVSQADPNGAGTNYELTLDYDPVWQLKET